MLEKARGLPCDVVVLDLEDSVAPEAKNAARDAVCAAVKSYGQREIVVRINPLASSQGKADLQAVRAAAPDALLLSKVESAADIESVRGPLPASFAIWAMIETPLGVLNAAAIAASGAA
jgi:citrate lyase beta subunit